MNQQGTVRSPPIPAYQNFPIEPQFYQPSQFFISNIVLGWTTIVTTTTNHNYVIGQECRLIIPTVFGCYQLNQQLGYVLSIPSSTEVELSINSTKSDSFIASSITFPSLAQIVAVGDINMGATNSQGRINNITYIPGSFIDISPL